MRFRHQVLLTFATALTVVVLYAAYQSLNGKFTRHSFFYSQRYENSK